MAKYYVGQEVYFVSSVFTPSGEKLCPLCGQTIINAVIDSIVITDYGTSYTFEGLTYRLPENQVFENLEQAKEYIKENFEEE